MNRFALDPQRAWLLVVAAATVNAVGNLVGLAIDYATPAVPAWPSAVASMIGVALIAALLGQRRSPNPRLVSLAFMVNTAAVVFAFHLTNVGFAAYGAHWVPFQADQLGALVAALLAPSLTTGTLSVAAYVILPICQYLGFSSAIRAGLAVGTPLPVVAFGVVAQLLLTFRFARVALERRVAAAESERRAMADLSAKIAGIKDLLNTPLQSLAIGLAILRERGGQDGELLDRIERAIASLGATTRALSKYEGLLLAEQRTLSFDSRDLVGPGSVTAPVTNVNQSGEA